MKPPIFASALLLSLAGPAFARDCAPKIEQREARGASLAGLSSSSGTIKIDFGFYSCNDVQREDLVAYAENAVTIVKIVKGLPGDKFHLEQAGDGWRILINGEPAENALKEPYLLNERGYKLLSLYERGYDGVIPPNDYLLLENLAGGALDSGRFGLIDKDDILGKVLWEKPAHGGTAIRSPRSPEQRGG